MDLNNVTSAAITNRLTETRTAREASILENVSHVHALAKRLQRRVPPCVTFDDLVGAGTIGLIQAVDRFQPSRDLKFGTYARHRIRGAMLDFLRDEDPVSRTARRRIRVADASRSATAESTPLPATISLEWVPVQESRRIYANADCPASRFADHVDVQRARQSLSLKENQVISLLYDADAQNRDVARALGVNESRVSQIKRAALSKLRARLQAGDPGTVA
jgi:RNA polymerase sigma factor for flagellar operon FliA